MNGFLLVGLGGGLGAMLRHAVNLATLRLALGGGAASTLFVNVAGSFAMGVLLAWLLGRGEQTGGGWWLFLGTGLFGGFTTFSAFSRETAHMLNSGEALRAGAYAGVSVMASVGALMAALVVTRKLIG